MADPVIQQTNKTTDVNLRDAMDLLKKEIMIGLNSHAIAKVESFDETKQTCQASIQYKRTYQQRQADGTYTAVLYDYPVLLDVPCIVLGGAGFALTMGDLVGEACVILFNDRDIDNWVQAGQVGPVASPRLHSISDGIALVGIRSLADSLVDYDKDRAVLRTKDGLAGVGVGPTLIKIFNDTTTLMTALTQLITAINSISTTNCVVGNPVVLSPASIAAINVAKTTLQGLLE